MFDSIITKIREELDEEDATREKTLLKIRESIRLSGKAVRAIHKEALQEAKELIDKTADLIKELKKLEKNNPKIYYKNYIIDAQQEFVEARLFYAFLSNEDFENLSLENLSVSSIGYLLGLGDLIGELRRFTLDCIRRDEIDKAEQSLEHMSEIYENLIGFDYPSGIIPGLRRKCDVARGIIEKTRGELTVALEFHKYASKIK